MERTGLFSLGSLLNENKREKKRTVVILENILVFIGLFTTMKGALARILQFGNSHSLSPFHINVLVLSLSLLSKPHTPIKTSNFNKASMQQHTKPM